MEDSCQTKLVDRYAVLCFTVKGVNASMVIQFLKDWLQKIETGQLYMSNMNWNGNAWQNLFMVAVYSSFHKTKFSYFTPPVIHNHSLSDSLFRN